MTDAVERTRDLAAKTYSLILFRLPFHIVLVAQRTHGGQRLDPHDGMFWMPIRDQRRRAIMAGRGIGRRESIMGLSLADLNAAPLPLR